MVIESVLTASLPPPSSNHVVIQQIPSGGYRAYGSYYGDSRIEYFAPPQFGKIENAIAAAEIWATTHSMDRIFLCLTDYDLSAVMPEYAQQTPLIVKPNANKLGNLADK